MCYLSLYVIKIIIIIVIITIIIVIITIIIIVFLLLLLIYVSSFANNCERVVDGSNTMTTIRVLL